MFPRLSTLFLLAASLLAASGATRPGEETTPRPPHASQEGEDGLSDLSTLGDPTARYRVLQWKVEQGLPENHVTAIVQTQDGYVWIGTIFGLVRYDGVRFTVFEKATLKLMRDSEEDVKGLAEDGSQALWVAAQNGLLRLADHRWQLFQKRAGPEEFRPTGVCSRAKGGAWVGSYGTVTHFGPEGAVKDYTIPLDRPKPIRKLVEAPDGSLWVATRYTVMHGWPDEGRWETVMTARSSEAWVQYLLLDADGAVCFGGLNGCYRVDAKGGGKPALVAGFTLSADGSRESYPVQAYRKDRKGRTWVATLSELTQVNEQPDGKAPVVIGSVRHPGLQRIEQMMVDREGNLWVGTESDGLLLLHERRFATLLPPNGTAAENNTWSVCEDGRGRLWWGTKQDLFLREEGTILPVRHPVTHAGPNPAGQVYSVCPDPQGTIWVGFGGYGLFKTDGQRWETGPIINDRPSPRDEYNIRCLYTDHTGALWIGTPMGLYRWQGGELVRYTRKEGLPGNEVRAILEDPDGSFWIGTYTSGMAHMQNGEFEVFNKTNGLPDNQVTCFLRDSSGDLWIGTGSGLTRLKGGKFATLTREEGLYDDLVNYMLDDGEGYFWISCNRGIYRIPREEAAAAADGTLRRVASMPFGEGDGMLSAETNNGGQPSGWKSRDGLLWFPTAKGLVRIDPRTIRSAPSPAVVIEQVIADQRISYGDQLNTDSGGTAEAVSPGDPLETRDSDGVPTLNFQAGHARVLELRYTANVFAEPSKVQFRYWLEGHDRDWQPGGNRRLTHYTALGPGSYTFKVSASSPYGDFGPPALLRFRISPFFYQRWWFFVLCGLSVVLAAAGVQSYRLHIQRRILQLEKEHALEKERARIAKDMHDDLGARLTQLGLISELVESPDFRQDPTASPPLPRVSSLAREAVRSLDEIVWAVTPGKNTLDQLAGYLLHSAQDLISPSGIRLDVRMPQQVPSSPLSSELRHNVYLVMKEALNNAVKHSEATRIILEMSFTSGAALLRVTDDGRGFDPGEAAGAGNGLANMAKRAESVGARFECTSRPGHGTSISIGFPLPSHSNP